MQNAFLMSTLLLQFQILPQTAVPRSSSILGATAVGRRKQEHYASQGEIVLSTELLYWIQARCLNSMVKKLTENELKLNPDTTEVILDGRATDLNRIVSATIDGAQPSLKYYVKCSAVLMNPSLMLFSSYIWLGS